VPAQRTAARARALAVELGLLDRVVFFNDAWVPYADRADWLLEAGCAVSTHEDHLETRFAYRTRLLDCLWARLPVVCTGGDDLGTLVEQERLGAVVAAGDVEATAAALAEVLDAGRGAYEPQIAAAAQRQTWDRVAEPLRRFLAAPPPPRPRRSAVRPAHIARTQAYNVARRALNLAGARDWPRL
jgi:glycosyltransferase involved in cell wall biosynthesis